MPAYTVTLLLSFIPLSLSSFPCTTNSSFVPAHSVHRLTPKVLIYKRIPYIIEMEVFSEFEI